MWRNVTFKCHPETAAFFELLRATRGFVSVPLLFYFFLLLPQAWRCFWREFPLFFLGAAAVKLLLIPDATITTPRLFSKRYQRMLWQQSFRVFSLVQKEKKSYKDTKVDFLYFFQGPYLDLWQWVDGQVRSVVGLYLQGLYQLSTSLAGAGLNPGLDFSTAFIVGGTEPTRCRSSSEEILAHIDKAQGARWHC